MPVVDGIEAFKTIKKIDSEIPIVALTAHAFENEKEKILQYDFTDYLAKLLKPKPKQIIQSLEKILGQIIKRLSEISLLILFQFYNHPQLDSGLPFLHNFYQNIP